MFAQIAFNEVTLVGGTELGLPLPKEYLEANEHILNIDIGKNTLNIEAGWKYIDGEFYPPEIIPEDTNSNMLINQEFVLANQISAQNRMLSLQITSLGITADELLSNENITLVGERTFEMYFNMYSKLYILKETVHQAVTLLELSTNQYELIVGEPYLIVPSPNIITNFDLESNQMIQMEAQVEVFDESNNNDLILMESIASIVESLDEIMLRLDRLEAK